MTDQKVKDQVWSNRNGFSNVKVSLYKVGFYHKPADARLSYITNKAARFLELRELMETGNMP